MNEKPKHLDDKTRETLHQEKERLAIIQQRWHQESFRLKRAMEHAQVLTGRAQSAMDAIERLLEVGKLELPPS